MSSDILHLETLRRFPPSARYLIGVSGGRDSVGLLHALLAEGYRRLIVCHLNHGLRGAAATADARLVARLAKQAELPFEERRVDVVALAEAERMSVETAGRCARYEFFAAVARKRRCPTVFLGQHADDLVETTLLNLFRGSGATGLANMRPASQRKVNGVTLTIVRPLLQTHRRAIDEYARVHALKFRDDATNADTAHMRNRIRHRVLPYIERQFGRDVRKSIHRAAELLAADEEWLAEIVLDNGAGGDELSVAALRLQATALQRRVIRAWLMRNRIAGVDF
ncbi:MAG: tRNA lysidine(34) synthetase TilS, partial [Verrucomicrobiota bacterium]|nr:tRNA lysidine(34) synthetase TilS [Verrucomicrobiota bacterium]